MAATRVRIPLETPLFSLACFDALNFARGAKIKLFKANPIVFVGIQIKTAVTAKICFTFNGIDGFTIKHSFVDNNLTNRILRYVIVVIWRAVTRLGNEAELDRLISGIVDIKFASKGWCNG